MGVSTRASRRYARFVPTFSATLLAVAVLAPGCGSDGDGGSGDDDDGAAGEEAGGAPGRGGSSSGKGGASGKGGSSGTSVGGGQGGANGGESSAGEGGGPSIPGLAYPLTLTPIGSANVATAHVSLYFTATDANDEPVPG